MKTKTTLLLLISFIFLAGNIMIKAQPIEVWNQTPTWNAGKACRGIAYNPGTNYVYVAGNTGATVAANNFIKILDAATGTEIKTLTLSPLVMDGNGYGIKDVEVSSDGGIFAVIPTTNIFNPPKLYYWEDEDAAPQLLWNGEGNDDDYGPGFSVYGDFSDEALIIVPFYDAAKVFYWEVVDGVLGDVTTLDLSGITGGTGLHVQALGTKITDGFWYSNSVTAPTKIDGSGAIVGSINAALFSGATGDVKQFAAGNSTYLTVSDGGSVVLIDITTANADFSNITVTEVVATIAGTAPSAAGWPSENGDGQEQAVLGNPDGGYAIYSISSDAYVKALAIEGAPIATNLYFDGTPLVGDVLTVMYTYVDINGDAEGTSAIKWYIADDDQGTNIAEITASAGSFTYTIVAGDAGKYLSFTIQAVAVTGTVSDVLNLAVSQAFGPVLTAMDPPVASNLAISGTVAFDSTLTGSYDYSDPNSDPEGDSILKWYKADDAAGTNSVEVGTGAEYIVAITDLGKFILFEVTPVATSGFLLEGSPVSVASANAVPTPPSPQALEIAITGHEFVTYKLTGSYTYYDIYADDEDGTTFQWYRADDAAGTNKVNVASVSMEYYTVAADEGKYILFGVTAKSTANTGPENYGATAGPIGAVPVHVAPVASNVVANGTAEVNAVLSGSYDYSDDYDLEGVSTFKWYVADDAAGGNEAEISGATAQTHLVTSADLGKFFAFEVTPVALTGVELVGIPVKSAYTAAGAVASDQTFGMERMWLASSKKGATPHYINTASATERGFAIGTDHIYVASRMGTPKVNILDKTDGSKIGELSMEGISGGIYPINDIEVSVDGQILAAPLNASDKFWIYKWADEISDPVKWLEVDLPESLRFGDKFSVTGDLSADAIILAAQGGAGSTHILRWVVTGGVAGTAELLTLGDITSMENSPNVVPFTVSTDANMLIDAKGFVPTIIDKDLNTVGTIARIDDYGGYGIQSNSPNVFYHKGRTLAAFFQAQRVPSVGVRIVVADITEEPYQVVDSSEYVSTYTGWDHYLGEVAVTTDADYYYAYVLAPRHAIAAYRGELNAPEFVSGITNYTGDTVMVDFTQAIKNIELTDAAPWTLTSGGNAITVDSIYNEGSTIYFTGLSATVAESEAVTIAYDGSGTIASFAGLLLAAFGPEDVENIVGAEVPVATDVAVTGDPYPTSVLTGAYTFTDPDGDLEGTSLYQWYEATDDAGANELKLLGENSVTYTVAADMTGKYLAFEVTPVSATGGADYLVGAPVKSAYILVNATGIEDNLFAGLVIYPNPVVSILTIDNCDDVQTVSIMNVTGKVIQTMETNFESRITINMEAYGKGIYFLKLNADDDSSKVVRIIKVQ